MKFKIPIQTEVESYMKTKMGWPDEFCRFYSERFWNHYQASGWKLSSGNTIKDWKACFNAQWQTPKYKEDITKLNECMIVKEARQLAPKGQIEQLDHFLQAYSRRPTDAPFESFGKFFVFMKEQRLLKPFSKEEIAYLREIYGDDNEKCRCACVQLTLNGYVNTGMTIAGIMEIRKNMAHAD